MPTREACHTNDEASPTGEDAGGSEGPGPVHGAASDDDAPACAKPARYICAATNTMDGLARPTSKRLAAIGRRTRMRDLRSYEVVRMQDEIWRAAVTHGDMRWAPRHDEDLSTKWWVG